MRETQSCTTPMTERNPRATLLAGQSQRGMRADFFTWSVGKTLPSGRGGRELLPHSRGRWAQRHGVSSREVTPGPPAPGGCDPSVQQGAQGLGQWVERYRFEKSQMAERCFVQARWEAVWTQGGNLLWEMPPLAELERMSCLWVLGHRHGMGTSGALIFIWCWKCLSWGLRQRGLFFIHAAIKSSSGFPLQK